MPTHGAQGRTTLRGLRGTRSRHLPVHDPFGTSRGAPRECQVGMARQARKTVAASAAHGHAWGPRVVQLAALPAAAPKGSGTRKSQLMPTACRAVRLRLVTRAESPVDSVLPGVGAARCHHACDGLVVPPLAGPTPHRALAHERHLVAVHETREQALRHVRARRTCSTATASAMVSTPARRARPP